VVFKGVTMPIPNSMTQRDWDFGLSSVCEQKAGLHRKEKGWRTSFGETLYQLQAHVEKTRKRRAGPGMCSSKQRGGGKWMPRPRRSIRSMVTCPAASGGDTRSDTSLAWGEVLQPDKKRLTATNQRRGRAVTARLER